jgi:hypothetical protein
MKAYFYKLINITTLIGFIGICSCHKSGTQSETEVSKDTTDVSYVDSTEDAIPNDTIRIFYPIENPKTHLIKGGDACKLYGGIKARLFCFLNYNVISSTIEGTAGEKVEVYRNCSATISDSISVSLTDSVLFSCEGMGVWFYGVKDKYIFFDHGTGPDRAMEIDNIETKEKILQTGYSSPVSVDSCLSVTYFTYGGKATESNCSEYKKYISEGLEPYIAKKVSFNILTRQRKDLGETHCEAFQ